MPNFWDVVKGDPFVWVILLSSVVVAAIAIERTVALWSFAERARGLADVVHRCLFRGAVAEGRTACERSLSPVADVFLVGFERIGRSSREVLRAALSRERLRLMVDLRGMLWIMGTVGALAPFLGLAGTVLGIMRALGDIKKAGQATFSVVAEGLSAALIATLLGLGVALVAIVIYNYFNQRLARISAELKMSTDEFRELLVEGGSADVSADTAADASANSAGAAQGAG